MRDERCLCGRESCLTCKLWLEVNLDTMDSLERHILPHWSNTTSNKSSDTTTPHCRDGSSVPRARAPRALVDLLGDVVRGHRHDRKHLVGVILEPADGRQRVIAQPEDDEQLLRERRGGMRRLSRMSGEGCVAAPEMLLEVTKEPGSASTSTAS